jgi:short-subunit dehydrogenase
MAHRGERPPVVVVTGASSGIGRATALEFARRGAAVVLAARRAALLEQVAAACRRAGGGTLVVPTDVTDAPAVDALADRALGRFGRVDVWVNNAGVALFGRLDDVPLAAFRRVLETNLLGCLHGTRAALRAFRRAGRGVLVNVASTAGKGGVAYQSAYVASKFAVVGLSETLRQELRDTGIHVCTVLPGPVDTPLFAHAANYSGRAPRPVRPATTPEAVARAIVGVARAPRRERLVGATARAMLALHAAAPSLYDRVVAAVVERDNYRARPAADGAGNLFAPVPGAPTTRPPAPRRRRLASAPGSRPPRRAEGGPAPAVYAPAVYALAALFALAPIALRAARGAFAPPAPGLGGAP